MYLIFVVVTGMLQDSGKYEAQEDCLSMNTVLSYWKRLENPRMKAFALVTALDYAKLPCFPNMSYGSKLHKQLLSQFGLSLKDKKK